MSSGGGSHTGAKPISHILPRKRSMKGVVVVRGSRQHYTATRHATPAAGAAAVSAAAVEGGSSSVAPEPGQQQSMTHCKALRPEKEANDEGGNGESAAEEKKKGNDESHDSLHFSPPSSLSSSYSSSCSTSSSSSLTTTCSSSSCPLSFPLSRPAWPVVPASLDGGNGEVGPTLSAATAHASSSPTPSLCLADPSKTGPRTPRHADCSVAPASQPTGFRRMPWDQVTGRRICYYFNHAGCMAAARCAYMHVKVDRSLITSGTLSKPIVRPPPSCTGLPSRPPSFLPSGRSFFPFPSRRVTCNPHPHLPSFPVRAASTPQLPPIPASRPIYATFRPPPSHPAAPDYAMHYVCAPPFYPPSHSPSYRPVLSPNFHRDSPAPVPMSGGEGGGEGPGGRWRGYHHQMQRGQQALDAMEAKWVSGPMEVRGAEMQYHHQRAEYQQYRYDYQYQQEQQQKQFEYCGPMEVRGAEMQHHHLRAEYQQHHYDYQHQQEQQQKQFEYCVKGPQQHMRESGEE